MKRFILLLAVFTMFSALSLEAQVFTENDIGGPTYLFVLSAQLGTMNNDTLTLTGVPSVVYFSDRPNRIAGHKTMEDFEGLWNNSSDSFKADPPNATLSILKEEGANNIVVELISMEHEESVAKFKIRVLEGKAPQTFGSSSLFVDNIPVHW